MSIILYNLMPICFLDLDEISLYATGGYLNSQSSDTQVFEFSPHRSDGSPARKKTKLYPSQPSTPISAHEVNVSGHDNAHLESMIVDIHEQIDGLSSKIEELDASALAARKERKDLEVTVGKLMGLRLMRLKVNLRSPLHCNELIFIQTALRPESNIDLVNISPASNRFSTSSESAFLEEGQEADTLSPGASQEIDGSISTQYLGQLAREFFGQ